MRDDFTQQTLDTIAKRVGVRCSNPSCRKLTTGPRSDSSKIVNIGVGAHITAASENGPRYNSKLSSEERKSANNGIWLCQNCAKLIDNDPEKYPIAALEDWKIKSEETARDEIEGNSPAQTTLSESINIEIDYKKLKTLSELHEYGLIITVQNMGEKIFENYHIDIEFPSIVLDNPEQNTTYVSNRSNSTVSFFRIKNHDNCNAIYPGDSRPFQPFEYYMTHKIYGHRGDLFNFIVKATLYSESSKLIIERKFKELQFF